MHLIALLIILLARQFNAQARGEGCETKIRSGGLLGTKIVSRSGREFCAFLGVPYAAPPVGILRFLPPKSPQSWEGVKNFTKESAVCQQYTHEKQTGSEDCLYLNIFTHTTYQHVSSTVMVYIHGGGFRIGSSSTTYLGPEYLMDRNIVLVTLQYRLGPFGFLSTGDKVIPGNMGLKDQVKALQWVQENIKCFGGDPGKVTLFGNSAGGASVHFHMKSPVSRHLFARGISQSGTSLSGFAVASKGSVRNISLDLASKLNCTSLDSDQILVCLQNKTSHEIISAHQDIIEPRYNRFLLRPVIEVNSEHAFLTAHPREFTTDKPWMVGITANEGITFLPFKRLNKILHAVNTSFCAVGPEIMILQDNYMNLKDVLPTIYEFYFKNNTSTNDRIQSLEQLITDSWFAWPTEKALANYNQTFYYYLYDHLGEHSEVEFHNNPQGFGVGHTDELLTLFFNKFYPPLNHQDSNISKLMVDFWVNFATEGNPTPHPISQNPQVEGEGNFTWAATRNIEQKYLHIQTHNLELKQGLYSSRMKLWRELESNLKNCY